ncbi:metal ABC transporter substrate-binding protein [Anaerotignum sp.]|uniref:metal ABC transporter substrate-binding protein n=1 Tax=Anaerotignum sp. TaxID=2039241 RepID=UPI00331F0363
MKKRIGFIVLMIFIFSGCRSTTSEDNSNTQIKVLTSFYPMYLLAEEITKGVEGIDLYNMAQPQTGCLHDYTLTTKDMQKLDEANVLLINGGGMESFLEQALEQFPDLVVIDTSLGIDLLESEHSHNHEHKEDEEDNHQINQAEPFDHDHEVKSHDHECENDVCGNSHIWLSPSRTEKQVVNMAKGLEKIVPQHREKIESNLKVFLAQLTELQNEAEVLDYEEGHMNVAIFHEGFGYLTELFHMNTSVQIFVDENEEPSAKELAEAVDQIGHKEIQLYLVADDNGKKYAEILAKECGGKVIVLNPITGNATAGESYISGMKHNITIIKNFIEGGHSNES